MASSYEFAEANQARCREIDILEADAADLARLGHNDRARRKFIEVSLTCGPCLRASAGNVCKAKQGLHAMERPSLDQ